jgi:hypothetical protein
MMADHISEDGNWRWDGQQWLPVPGGLTAPGGVPAAFATNPGNNGTATFALVVAIASPFVCWGVGGILGLFLALAARKEIRRNGQAGEGIATAALIISAIHLGILGLVIAGFSIVFIAAAASGASHTS